MLANQISRRLNSLLYSDLRHAKSIRKIKSLSARDKFSLGVKRTVRLMGEVPYLWHRTIEQTPDGSCIFGNTLFVASGSADYYVILNNIRPCHNDEKMLAEVNSDRIWWWHMEPPAYIDLFAYHKSPLVNIASRVYTTHAQFQTSNSQINLRLVSPYVHLHLGLRYNQIAEMPRPKKNINFGSIVSSIRHLSGHEQRLKFASDIDQQVNNVVFWGRGLEQLGLRCYRGSIHRKWMALVPLRYCLVMENSRHPHYWSEKIADTFLSYSMPIYSGDPLIKNIFPPEAFAQVELADPASPSLVQDIIQSNAYDIALPAIHEARQLLLRQHNFYAVLDRELNEYE